MIKRFLIPLLIGLTSVANAADERLTTQQRIWLAEHPVIKISPDPDFPPIEYIDDRGHFQGIAADYVALLEKKLGIQFEIVAQKDWNTSLEQAQNRQVDMFTAAAATPQRLEYMNFTRPHLVLPGVILVSDRVMANNLTMNDLKGQRVAVVGSYVWEELINNDRPEIELVPMPNLLSGLKALSFGSVDAMIANLAIATHYIKQAGITNLKVAGESGYYGRYAFAVRKDWPELIGILEAGMDAITPEEHRTILNRWVHLDKSSIIDTRSFWITLLITAVSLIVIGTLLWNRQLQRQVKQRTKELTQALEQQLATEQSLRTSQQRYAVLFNQAYDGIFLMAVDQASVIDCNIAACHQFGCSKSDLQKIPPYQRSPHFQPDGEESEQKARRLLQQAANGESLIFEWQHYRSDNTPFDSEVSMACVTSDQQRFIMAIVRDISERKRIDKLKDDFISTVSHEIRTPLTSIRGSLGLIHGGVAGKMPEKAMSLIEIAHNNTNRLLHLVNDLLDIQKLESGLSQFTIVPTNLKHLLEQAIEANSAYATTHHTTLKLNEVDETLELPMDHQRIMQVMNNLLSNAAKFSPDGSQIEITTEKRVDDVRITIIDQGPGVPEEFLPHLFERFTQADSSATRKTSGTGLGLSITKAIVEHHHGEIGYERNQRGSCFYFALPLKQ